MRAALVLVLPLLLTQDLDPKRDELAARLETLRALKFKSPPPLRAGTRREYGAYVLDNARRVYGEDLAAAEKGLKALGLLPPKMRLELAIGAQAGLGVKVFCAGGEVILLDPMAGDEWILNKMDLALVDQHFPAPKAATFDAQMAWAALRMGDAEVVKHLIWTQGRIGDDAVAKVAGEALAWEKGESKLASAVVPRMFVRAGEFPWRRGAAFALTQYRAGRLDAAFAKPPVSTEQILHPEKYEIRERPVHITAAPLTSLAPRKEARRDVMGELIWRLWFDSHLSVAQATDAAAGWGGDRLVAYESPGDSLPAVVSLSAWDSDYDANEAEAAARKVLLVLAGQKEPSGSHSPSVGPAGFFREKGGVSFGLVRRGRLLLMLAGIPKGTEARVTDEVFDTFKVEWPPPPTPLAPAAPPPAPAPPARKPH